MIAIENLTDDELQALMIEIAQEQGNRKTRMKEVYWEPIRKSILAYLSEVGDITIETWDNTYHINNNVHLEKLGVIDIEAC